MFYFLQPWLRLLLVMVILVLFHLSTAPNTVTVNLNVGTAVPAGDDNPCPTLLTPDTPPGYCTATTYWVGNTGQATPSDSNPGTYAQPFASIQHAADVVDPGDVVLVENGDYSSGASGSDSAVVNLTRGGDATHWVTFKSIHQYGAVLDGESLTTWNGFDFNSGANYIRVEGFDVGTGIGNPTYTATVALVGSSSGFELYDGGSNTQIVGNKIRDIGKNVCSNNENGLVGIFTANQTNVTIESNDIYDIGRLRNGESGCGVAYNSRRDHGIYLNEGHNVLVRNNLFWHNIKGYAIQMYPDPEVNSNIVNNSFYQGNADVGFIIVWAAFTSSQIANNTFYDTNSNKGAPIVNYAGTTGPLVVRYNTTDASSIWQQSSTGLSLSNNTTSRNPSFESPGPPTNFHLANGSLNIDAGVDLSSLAPFDYAGTSRPQSGGFDIGAYER